MYICTSKHTYKTDACGEPNRGRTVGGVKSYISEYIEVYMRACVREREWYYSMGCECSHYCSLCRRGWPHTTTVDSCGSYTTL